MAGRGSCESMRVRNAGAIFVGSWSPVSLGDYAAGSNHVLPTGGCACHSSGLSVQTFLRGIHVVDYDEAALADALRDLLLGGYSPLFMRNIFALYALSFVFTGLSIRIFARRRRALYPGGPEMPAGLGGKPGPGTQEVI